MDGFVGVWCYCSDRGLVKFDAVCENFDEYRFDVMLINYDMI